MTGGKSWSPLERRAREWFTQSVEELDAPTLSRLNEARHAALAERAQESRAASGRWRGSRPPSRLKRPTMIWPWLVYLFSKPLSTLVSG